MPKKMRILFALFITLPLMLSITIDPEELQKSIFMKVDKDQIKKKEDFMTKTEEEKDKILKELDKSILDLNEKIKKYISEKNEYPNDDIVDLMNKIIEIIAYMEAKVCNQQDNNYNNCINEKKRFMKNLLSAVEYNFGKCDVTLEHINKLTNYVIYNLSLLSNLIEYIIQNIDYMEKSQAYIITNILECLGFKTEGYWPAVSAQLEKDGFSAEQVSLLKELNIESLFEEYAKMYKLKSGTELNLNNPRDKRKEDLAYLFKDYAKMFKLKSGTELNLNNPRDKRKEDVYKEIIDVLKENLNNPRDKRREDVYKEIIDVLKEIRESKNDKTLIIIISCLATMIILVGGFFLYRFIRRKNSNLIENTKDLVASENK